jgi:hypothetical protein
VVLTGVVASARQDNVIRNIEVFGRISSRDSVNNRNEHDLS